MMYTFIHSIQTGASLSTRLLAVALVPWAAGCMEASVTEPVGRDLPRYESAPTVASVSPATLAYDLREAWSDADNPNGPWSVYAGDVLLSPVSDLSSTGIDGWPTAQPGFSGQPVLGDITPVWFRAVVPLANGDPDYEIGDIVTHTSRPGVPNSNLRWTSELDGLIDISGSVWAAREFGRTNDWFLYHNDQLLTSGTVASGDPYDRENPFHLDTGSGGAAPLTFVTVSVGDVLKLEFEQKFGFGEDYVGVDLTISVAAPTTMDDCKNGGWKLFGFRNYGQCVRSVASDGAGGGKVAVCHLHDGGAYQLIEVSQNALPAHFQHGDGVPGAEAPNGGGVFDDGCALVEQGVSYAFEFQVTTSRYFGSDPTIEAALPAPGLARGVLTYDPGAEGAPSTSPAFGTVYDMGPAGSNGMRFTFDNGLVWETDPLGHFDTWVVDRVQGGGPDAVRFRSDDAILKVPGLATDFAWLTFFESNASLLDDETLPASLDLTDWTFARLDLRAVDSNNSEFRVFGTLTSLTEVP